MNDCDLIIPVERKSAEKLLEAEWRWLLGKRSVRPRCLTIFGDWFLEDKKTGEVYFLDTAGGKLSKAASSRASLERKLEKPENRQKWLLEGQVRMLQKHGIKPAFGECYGWKMQPCLGGSFECDNIEPTELALHEHLSSRLAYMAKDLPPGTRITEEMIQDVMDNLDEPLGVKKPKKPAKAPIPYARIAATIGIIALGLIRFLR
jgi:hypothetical protein